MYIKTRADHDKIYILKALWLKYVKSTLELYNHRIEESSVCRVNVIIYMTTPLFVCSDIRELIMVDDVMEDDSLRFGPNGGLVFCMEYFANNFDWLEESLGHVEDDYILFDCPGKRPDRGGYSWCKAGWGFSLCEKVTVGEMGGHLFCQHTLWWSFDEWLCLCRSDRTVHTPPCNEAAGGAASAVGVSGVRGLSGRLPVHGGVF